jgi:hypothetical protein
MRILRSVIFTVLSSVAAPVMAQVPQAPPAPAQPPALPEETILPLEMGQVIAAIQNADETLRRLADPLAFQQVRVSDIERIISGNEQQLEQAVTDNRTKIATLRDLLSTNFADNNMLQDALTALDVTAEDIVAAKIVAEGADNVLVVYVQAP